MPTGLTQCRASTKPLYVRERVRSIAAALLLSAALPFAFADIYALFFAFAEICALSLAFAEICALSSETPFVESALVVI